MNTAYRYILASASPRRKELLGMLGIDFEIIPSGAEEDMDQTEPSALVERLSFLKASDVYTQIAGSGTGTDGGEKSLVVIGADTVVYCGGRILGKPSDKESARKMLQFLSGRMHAVYTGVSLIWGKDRSRTFYEMTEVEVSRLSDEEISAYIESGEPFDKAGAYGIQGLFMKHVSGIRGDYNNVVGLPVAALYRNMKETGLI